MGSHVAVGFVLEAKYYALTNSGPCTEDEPTHFPAPAIAKPASW